MSTNAIPRSIRPLVRKTEAALDAAIRKGAAYGLPQSTTEGLTAVLHGLVGAGPGDPLRGSNGALALAVSATSAARQNHRSTVVAGQVFCRTAVAVLKKRLNSNSWTPQWEAAGFTQSLSIPNDPLNLLRSLREYFVKNPDHESADLEVSVDRAHAVAEAIKEADRTVNARKAEETAARQVRDAGVAQLRRRMGNLREELSLLLKEDDARWYDFGFNRPVDGRVPGRIKAVRLEALRPGELLVRWDEPVRAESYRVVQQVVGVDEKPVQVGLFGDPQTILTGLPSGKTVKVIVSAHNASGDSKAAEASATVG